MSEKIEKLLALAFDTRTQEGEANNAFSLARKLLGSKSIPDFLGLGSNESENIHSYSLHNLPASHKDNYIEYVIGHIGKLKGIRVVGISIVSEKNLVTTPSKIEFTFSWSNHKSKEKIISLCKEYLRDYNDKLERKKKQNFNNGMDNVGARKPYQNTTPPPRQYEDLDEAIRNAQRNAPSKPKESFWKRAWNWIKEN